MEHSLFIAVLVAAVYFIVRWGKNNLLRSRDDDVSDNEETCGGGSKGIMGLLQEPLAVFTSAVLAIFLFDQLLPFLDEVKATGPPLAFTNVAPF